jgi:predicted oxidoreductase
MRYRLLGRSGLRVSEVCLGAMVFGDTRGPWGATREDAREILSRFAEAGGNFIDTASNYARGASEEIVGELVAADRDRWVLATKYTCSSRPEDPNSGGNHKKSLVQSLETSLRRLKVDYVDVLWVHIWDALTPIEEVVRAPPARETGPRRTPARLHRSRPVLARQSGPRRGDRRRCASLSARAVIDGTGSTASGQPADVTAVLFR